MKCNTNYVIKLIIMYININYVKWENVRHNIFNGQKIIEIDRKHKLCKILHKFESFDSISLRYISTLIVLSYTQQ